MTVRQVELHDPSANLFDRLSGNDMVDAYVLTAVASEDVMQTGSNSNSIGATIIMSMYWTDYFGLNNVLTKIYTAWEITSGGTTMNSNEVTYGNTSNFMTYSGRKQNVANYSFWNNINYTAFSFWTKFTCTFKNGSNTQTFNVRIESSNW